MTSGQGGDESAALSRPPKPQRPWREPATALIAAAVLLPILLFVLAAWESYRTTLRDAENRAERTARILEEHALKVFETQRLVIQQVNNRLRFVDWSREEDRADLHKLLEQLQDDLDQVATVTVTDADGRMRASGRIYPADSSISFADRDYFQALKTASGKLPFVSRSYAGRLSGLSIFNLAERIEARRGRSGDVFQGVIAVSVDRAYFEHFYETVEPTLDHSVVLVRADGDILARVPPVGRQKLPATSVLLSHVSKAPWDVYVATSKLDDVERIFAYRKIGDYPVYVRFGINMKAALAPWRLSLFAYGLVAALASLALVAVSMLALRQTDRERLARHRWEETAAALRKEAAERTRVEEQLRQAQKMEAVGRLTGGIAHDFNNLLTAVIGSLDLVRRRKDRVDQQTLGLVDNAFEGAQRAAALTSRLLAFSRQQPLQPTRLDANALVAGMSDLLCRTLGATITIRTLLGNDLWPILSDPNQLENAILNLAVNARDAMPRGGVLRIETANAPAATSTEGRVDLMRSDYVAIIVADTGTGMPPAVLANIFEPFFTTKPAGRGTGLGLSQVYGFVKQSGGQVGVESEVGRGTTFKIYLPRLTEAATAPPAPIAARASRAIDRRGRGETILVVEDEPMVLRLSVEVLEEAGYRVVSAADGRAALDVFRREPEVVLLFTDVVLGGTMNGRELADAILKERPDLPVLFTSGYTRDAIVHDGRLDAGVALLAKPFASGALVARVGELLAPRTRSDAPLAAL